MTAEGEGRPTNSSIDARVARVELAQAATDKKVDELTFKLGYMDEFNKLKFGTLEAQNSALSSKMDAFISEMRGLIQKGMEQAGDLRASSAGRLVDDRLDAVEERGVKNREYLDQMRGAMRLAQGMAALGAALGGLATAISFLHLRVP